MLYVWNRSIALGNYAPGQIIVQASSLKQARAYALERFKIKFAWRIDLDEDDDEDLPLWTHVLETFSKDISAEPVIYHGPVAILIEGSE